MATLDFTQPFTIHIHGTAYLITVEQSTNGKYFADATRLSDGSRVEITDNQFTNPDDAKAYTIGWLQMRGWGNL